MTSTGAKLESRAWVGVLILAGAGLGAYALAMRTMPPLEVWLWTAAIAVPAALLLAGARTRRFWRRWMRRPSGLALRVSLAYVLGAGLWIVFSDKALGWLVPDAVAAARIATYKGLIFVGTTTVLLFWVLRQQMTRLENEAAARGRALRALDDSESRYRSLFENMTEGFAYHRLIRENGRPVDYVFLAVNEAFGRLTGLQDVVGKPVSEVIPGIHERDPRLLEIYGRVATTGQPESFEMEVAALGLWFFVSAYCPEPDHFVAVFEMITERKKAEEALRASEERLRLLIDLLPDALFINQGDRIVFINQRGLQLWRAEKSEQVLGRSPFDFIHPDYHEAVRERIRRLRATGDIAPIWETRMVALDGTVVPVETTATLLPLAGTQAIQVVVRDITARKRAEEELRFHQAILEETGRLAHVGGWSFDVATGRGCWTDEAARIHDLDPAEPIDRDKALGFYAERSRPKIDAAVRAAVEQGIPYDLELEIVSAKGVRKWVRTIGRPVTENGRIVQLRGSFQDITDRKELEQKFLRTQRLEAVGTLAGGVAHDLNNVLTPVLMATALLKDKLAAERERGVLGMIEKSAQRGANIVKQLLSFSRGAGGERVRLQPRHLVKDMVRLMEETFPRNIAIEWRAPNDLWVVTADPTQVEQVLMNLCLNARDAMPRGGRLLVEADNSRLEEAETASRAPARPGPYVMLSVTDTGVGIPAEIIGQVFDPFFTTKTSGQGTGLGLSTVKSIATAHGGFVTVDSKVGQGATFRVYLPASPEGDEAAGAGTGAVVPLGREELILVIDDEPVVCQAVREALESFRYRVLTATDGREAIKLFIQYGGQVKLALVDLMMPAMNGFELIRSLRILCPGLRVIVCSGLAEADVAEELASVQPVTFVPKPHTSEQLLRAIGLAMAPATEGEPGGNPAGALAAEDRRIDRQDR